MLSVIVRVNGKQIIRKKAVRMGGPDNGTNQYRTDTNRILEHLYEDGAERLAIKLLELAREERIEEEKERVRKAKTDPNQTFCDSCSLKCIATGCECLCHTYQDTKPFKWEEGKSCP